jgi:hypothetical protein
MCKLPLSPYFVNTVVLCIRDVRVTIILPPRPQVIKFATSAGSGKAGGATITEKDVDMAKLYQAVRHLDENLAAIEREMEQEYVHKRSYAPVDRWRPTSWLLSSTSAQEESQDRTRAASALGCCPASPSFSSFK